MSPWMRSAGVLVCDCAKISSTFSSSPSRLRETSGCPPLAHRGTFLLLPASRFDTDSSMHRTADPTVVVRSKIMASTGVAVKIIALFSFESTHVVSPDCGEVRQKRWRMYFFCRQRCRPKAQLFDNGRQPDRQCHRCTFAYKKVRTRTTHIPLECSVNLGIRVFATAAPT